MTQIIVAFLTGVAGPILVMLIKAHLDRKKSPSDMVADAVEIGNLVTAKIEHIKEEFNADRVWIAQFHNGGHFYPTGKSIAKFSVFYETVKVGIQSIQNNFQNIPVNLFSKSINQLLENSIIEIYDYNLITKIVSNQLSKYYYQREFDENCTTSISVNAVYNTIKNKKINKMKKQKIC